MPVAALMNICPYAQKGLYLGEGWGYIPNGLSISEHGGLIHAGGCLYLWGLILGRGDLMYSEVYGIYMNACTQAM